MKYKLKQQDVSDLLNALDREIQRLKDRAHINFGDNGRWVDGEIKRLTKLAKNMRKK